MKVMPEDPQMKALTALERNILDRLEKFSETGSTSRQNDLKTPGSRNRAFRRRNSLNGDSDYEYHVSGDKKGDSSSFMYLNDSYGRNVFLNSSTDQLPPLGKGYNGEEGIPTIEEQNEEGDENKGTLPPDRMETSDEFLPNLNNTSQRLESLQKRLNRKNEIKNANPQYYSNSTLGTDNPDNILIQDSPPRQINLGLHNGEAGASDQQLLPTTSELAIIDPLKDPLRQTTNSITKDIYKDKSDSNLSNRLSKISIVRSASKDAVDSPTENLPPTSIRYSRPPYVSPSKSPIKVEHAGMGEDTKEPKEDIEPEIGKMKYRENYSLRKVINDIKS